MLDAHIHFSQIPDAEKEQLLKIEESLFFNNSASVSEWQAVFKSSSDLNVIPFLGVHSWYANEWSGDLNEQLRNIIRSQNVGVGEIGLDRARQDVDFEVQEKVFCEQLEIACEFHRPISVHCVRAWSDLQRIIKTVNVTVPVMLHSFSGSLDLAEYFSKRGFYFSFSPRQIDWLKKNDSLPDRLLIDKILIESDYPFLPKGSHGYLESIMSVYDVVAKVYGMDVSELTAKVSENGKIFADRIISGKREA